MTRGSDIVIVQTTIPDYRHRFFRLLASELGPRMALVAGTEDFYPDIVHAGGLEQRSARNRFLVRHQLLWQSGVLDATRHADIVVLVFNPRILSNWVVLVRRRVARRTTILWGHAWSRRGPRRRSNVLRGAMRRLAHALIVYTQTEADELRRRVPGIRVGPAPNALYTLAELEARPVTTPPTDIVYVGRLTPQKKPGLLVDAFRLALGGLPPDVRLVLAGDGPLRDELARQVEAMGLSERVRFLGHVSEVEELAEIYRTAIVSVSPGYAGLSLIQSLGFGVPMVVARDEPHAPEIEAALEGVNVVFVPSDNPAALGAGLVSVVEDAPHWLEKREVIAAPVRSRYSVEGMVASYIGALRAANRHSSSRGAA